MNRKGARAFMILPVILLALGSCGIFLVTIFPMASALTVAQRDFSSEITGGILDKFHPFVLEKDGTRLILLVGGHPYDSTKPWLFVMREDLSPIAQYTINDLALVAGPVFGDSAVIDCYGNPIIGNVRFALAGDTITPTGPAGNLGNRGGLNNFQFSTGLSMGNACHFSASGPTLNWDQYDCSWNFQYSYSQQFSTSGRELRLRDVCVQPYPATSAVTLVLEENDVDSSTSIFVRVPRNQFSGGLLPNFLDDDVSYPRFTRTNISMENLGFTADGIVAYEYETGDWTLTPPGSTVVSQRLHVGRMDGEGGDTRIGWSYSGGYSCVYDPRTRALSKVAKWWN